MGDPVSNYFNSGDQHILRQPSRRYRVSEDKYNWAMRSGAQYPELADPSVRISTFDEMPEMWPHRVPSARTLARAGFFFSPSEDMPDKCVCFHCGIALVGWEQSDVPALEHLVQAPTCHFAIRSAGNAQAIRDGRGDIMDLYTRRNDPCTKPAKSKEISWLERVRASRAPFNKRSPSPTDPDKQANAARLVSDLLLSSLFGPKAEAGQPGGSSKASKISDKTSKSVRKRSPSDSLRPRKRKRTV
eukprot:123879_1